MSDIIYVGVSDSDPDHYFWVQANSSGDAVSAPGEGDLQALASACQSMPIHLILSSDKITMLETDLPVTGKKLLTALPFALEEHFPGEIDTLHFAAGDKREDDTRGVVVVPRDVLATVLETLAAANLSPRAAYALPDALDAVEGHLQILLTDDVAIIDGAGVEPVSFRGLPLQLAIDATIASLGEDSESIRQLQIYADDAGMAHNASALDALDAGSIPVDRRALSQGWFGFAARALMARRGTDLLQGQFAVRADTMAAIRPWYAAAGLLAAVGLMAFTTTAIEARALSRQAANLDQQIVSRLTQLTGERLDPGRAEPQLSNVLNRRQAGRGNGSAQSTSSGVDFLDYLIALSDAGAETPPEIEAISYDNGTLNLQLVTESDIALEELREAITESGELEARILRTERKEQGQIAGRIQVTEAAL
ncbi:MAG: type II secretion system protein GspL [Pseudomonadota bacterium]